MFVRIPRWTKMPDAGKFRRYDREWKAGDAVELDFPMEIELTHWDRDAVSIRRGPFLYALKIDEDWQKVEKYKVPYEKEWVDGFGGNFPRWEIRPKSPWNYALVLDGGRLSEAEVSNDGIEIRTKAVRTEASGWGFLRADAPGRAIDPPWSPVDRIACSPVETVTLVPIGMTQIRIALFPWTK